jgi:uridine kinase
MTTLRSYVELADQVRAAAVTAPIRLVGVDGCCGAGKSTFAARLAHAASEEWQVVHTDDFASHDVPMQWWPSMLSDVIEPLAAGRGARFRRYDWLRREFSTVTTIEPADVVVIEGVGATRKAWRERLALRIWIDAPRDVRLARGIERDGEALREFWNDWMAAEDGYVADEDPQSAADLVVNGSPQTPHDERVFVVISERRRGEEPSLRQDAPR